MQSRAIWTVAAATAGVVLACCGSSSGPAKAPTRTVSAAEFADVEVVRVAPAPAEYVIVERPGSTGGTEMVTIVGDAPMNAGMPIAGATGDQLVVDEMVGQINGKPIYAEEFFRSMDARLRELATQMPLRQWVKQVRTDVEGKLWDVTRDELLLAEFRSTLTPEVKVGVLAFIEDVRRDYLSQSLGSSELANQRSLEEEGMTLNERVKSDTERQFVLQQLRRSIANRVYVSSRDIEQYYDQHYDEFNPPSEAVFLVIRVPLSDTVAISRVESMLAKGEPFALVAATESGWAKDKGNQHRVTIKAESFQDQQYWAVEELNTPSQHLTVGQSSGRIDARGAAWWIKLEAIEKPPGQPLYAVQLEIERGLKAERMKIEELRYFEKLLTKSNMSDFESMTIRLVEYAAVRYYLTPEAEAAAGG